MKQSPFLRPAGAALFLAAVLPLAGCLVAGHSSQTITGNYVSPAAFSQIKPGVTTSAWVQGVLGPPNSQTTLDNGHQLWRYLANVRTQSSGAVFVLMAGDSTTDKPQTTLIEFKDGVVVNIWRD
jgi:outer membrane protein assembly factor BamE (lipoprotein component of BamABCDE complex)